MSPTNLESTPLARDLARVVEGDVRFTSGDRGLYASDASNYRMVPIGVVLPRDASDVERALAVCRQHGAPVFARGGGTGIPGQSVNHAVLFDFSRYMDRVIEIDADRRLARVEPGVVLDTLRDAATPHGLTFGPDPATHSRCTLGGMIGNNSCGSHSVMAGRTSDNIEALEILTYGGTRLWVGATSEAACRQMVAEGGARGALYHQLDRFRQQHAARIRQEFPDIPRRVSGYNLPALLDDEGFHVARALVGSECTCVLVLQAVVRLVPNPGVRSLLVLGYPDIFTAGDRVVEPLASHPIALEALDDTFIDDMKKKGLHPPHLDLMPEGRAWLLVEFGGRSKADADQQAHALMNALREHDAPPSMKLFDKPDEERLIWHLREEGLGATARVPGEPDNHEGWEDSAVPVAKVGAYLRDLRALFEKYGYEGALYGHFGQGCVHTRLTFDLKSAAGIAAFRAFLDEAAVLVVHYGGSLSGEHGDGQARGPLLPRMFSPEMMQAFREFKAIWDPAGRMNPGKLIDAYGVDAHLRLGAGFNLPNPATHFAFADDHYSFAEATERCVGAGVCRRHGGGTMCPSYMATRDEQHSTRGRARLLNEMLRGDPVVDGWRSEAVKDALDLCLSCKGCKSDCPVQVDMATCKAEFLAHYYEGRWRPRAAYMMGHIRQWARLARIAPAWINLATHAPGLRTIAKRIADVHPARSIPAFATQTFTDWFRRRPRPVHSGPRVMIWPDTFNDHFHPRVLQSAVLVIEHLGFRVHVPPRPLCCGRPLYDWGLLDQAKARLRDTLSALHGVLEQGWPIVVLEPSCASVFRDEAVNLLPHDEDAKRLRAQTLLLSEFLQRHAAGATLPQLRGRALLHAHCHHKALMTIEDEVAVLQRMGLDVDAPETGCCGMAGAFGFETAHYAVSMTIGERALLPAVRGAAAETFVIADGFSCHEQIAQATDRQPMHLAEVLRAAIEQPASVRAYPERAWVPAHARDRPWSPAAVAGAAGLTAIALALALVARRARAPAV